MYKNNDLLYNVKIVETGIKYGNMNTASSFFPEGMSAEEREKIFLDRRLRAGHMILIQNGLKILECGMKQSL